MTTAAPVTGSAPPGGGVTDEPGDLAGLDDAAAPPGRATPWGWLLAGGLVVLLVRLWASRNAMTIEIVADEPGYLGMARYIAGVGERWNMAAGATYSAGYSFLIAPSFWLSDDPAVIYRTVILINVVLGVATFGLLWAFARRLTALSPRLAAVAAAAVAIAPATSEHANWAWSESLVTPLFLGLALVCVRLAERPSPRGALAATVLGPLAYLAHGRLMPVLVVVLGLLLVATVRRWIAPLWGAASLGVLVVASYATRAAGHAISEPLFEVGGAVDQTRYSLGRATNVSAVLVEVAGQTWYQLVATAGLAGLGVVALLLALRSRPQSPSEAPDPADPDPVESASWSGPSRSDSVILLAMIAVAMATSMAFMADRPRPDQLVYGRYNDAVTGPLVLAGLGWLMVRRTWTQLLAGFGAVLAALAALGGSIWVVRTDELAREPFVRSTVLGLMPFLGESPGIRFLRISWMAVMVIGLVAAAALVAARHRRLRVLPVAVVGVLAVVALLRTDPVIRRDTGAEARLEQVAVITEETVEPGDVLRYKWNPLQDEVPVISVVPLYSYQFYLPDNRIELDPPWREPTDTPFVFSLPDDPELKASGARLAWLDPYNVVGLWVEPGPRADELERAGALLPPGYPSTLPERALAADLSTLEPVRVSEQGRLSTTLRIDPEGRGSPWPVSHGGFGQLGTVRAAVSVIDSGCDCAVRQLRVNLPRQVSADSEPFELPVDVELDGLGPGRYRVELQLVQEGFVPFGDEIVREITVP